MSVSTAGTVPPNSGYVGGAPTTVNAVTAPSSGPGIKSDGWYLFSALVVSTALGGTKAAPIIFGVLTVALIYQVGLMLEGK